MTTNKQINNDLRNEKIIQDYQKTIDSGKFTTKGKFAEIHGVSHRTLNRILDDASLKDAVPTVTKKKPTASAPALKKKSVEAKVTVKDAPVKEEVNIQEEVSKELAAEPLEVEELGIISWTVNQNRFISVMLTTGEALVVETTHEHYDEIIHNLAIGNYQEAIITMSIKHKIQALKIGAFVVSHTGVTFNGVGIKNDIVDDIIELFLREEPLEYLLKFYENLLTTASEQIYKDLWKLIKHSGVTITPEGNVECFKKVKNDFTDCYTGKIDNSIGVTVTMRRTDVNHDPSVTCSTGLHVCAFKYLKDKFGTSGKIVKVVVRPQDFVSIPFDYSFTKARTCQYQVVADVTADVQAGKYN